MVTIGLQEKTHYNYIISTVPHTPNGDSEFIGIISFSPDVFYKIHDIHKKLDIHIRDVDNICDIQILPHTNIITVYSDISYRYYKIECRNMEVIRNLQDMKRISN